MHTPSARCSATTAMADEGDRAMETTAAHMAITTLRLSGVGPSGWKRTWLGYGLGLGLGLALRLGPGVRVGVGATG